MVRLTETSFESLHVQSTLRYLPLKLLSDIDASTMLYPSLAAGLGNPPKPLPLAMP